MDREIRVKIELCERADNAEWDEVIVRACDLRPEQTAFLREHPPGLVKALWTHFDGTRDRCGCTTPAHERPGCAVPLIERLLLDGELA
jgi:hypothetical protein